MILVHFITMHIAYYLATRGSLRWLACHFMLTIA